jgi:nickel-dependent lactate racemase
MSLFFAAGSATTEMSPSDVRAGLFSALDKLGKRKKVLAVPPDFTRMHSQSGVLTEMAWDYYGENLVDVLPALGTHKGMTDEEISIMFGKTPRELFRVHDWRNDIVTLGEVPSEFMYEVSEGKLDYTWPAQVNKLLRDGGHDLILSIGQVVPHEVVGMANYNKNIFVGTGGSMGIHRSHFLGAVYGMERMMGRADTPVRRVLNYASDHFAQNLPIVYVQTVVSKNDAGHLVIRGMYIGDDVECFERAAELSLKVNFKMMDREIKKAVVFLDPHEFRSTWLGNKSVYRTRMALADNAELIVLAPGVHEFGEDAAIDVLIRKYGYCGTPKTLEYVKEDPDLAGNLSAAAHLIHGSSEGRFTIRYCPGHLTREEIESVHYEYGDLAEALKKYNPETLQDGWNTVDGEEIFYISNPGLGLWAYQGRFKNLQPDHIRGYAGN